MRGLSRGSLVRSTRVTKWCGLTNQEELTYSLILPFLKEKCFKKAKSTYYVLFHYGYAAKIYEHLQYINQYIHLAPILYSKNVHYCNLSVSIDIAWYQGAS